MAQTPGLKLSNLLTRLGWQGTFAPGIKRENAAPVVVMADFSRTLSNEPVEARALAADKVSAGGGAGQHASLDLLAQGRDLVVEDIEVSSAAGTDVALIRRLATPHVTTIGYMQLGGVDAIALLTQSLVAAAPARDAAVPSGTKLQGIRWYIPSGYSLRIQPTTANNALTYALTWREVVE